MSLVARLRSAAAGLRAMIRPSDEEASLDEELSAFLDAATDDLIAGGVDPVTARRQARLALGDPLHVKEEIRATGWEHHVEMAWHDARYACRVLRRTPGFTVIVVLTLGLGIGGNAAILGLIDTLYFARLPVPGPNRVLRLNDSTAESGGEPRLYGMHSQNVAEVTTHAELFTSTAAMFEEALTITGDGEAERVTVISRTSGWRDTLGIAPVSGRDFTKDEESKGRASGVALVSDGLWARRFAGRRPGSAVVHLDGRPFTIVGVMPPGFRFPYEADVWIPHVVDPADHGRDYAVFARMTDASTLEQVRAAMPVIAAGLKNRYPDELPGYGIAVRTLRDNLVSDQADTSLALLPIVGFLLLLACVNVATLLLARSVARRKETAVRAVLGASAVRQLRQAMTETALLAGCGAVLGLLVASWIAPALVTLVPPNLVQQLGMSPPGIGWRVIAVTAVLSVAAGIGCALLPVIGRAGRTMVGLREGGRGGAADTPRSRRLLNVLVTAQVVLAVLLLSGAAAMIENLMTLQHRNLGVATGGLLSFSVTPSRVRYPDGASRAQLAHRMIDQLAAVPGVVKAGLTTVNPFGGTSWAASIIREGRDTGAESDAVQVNHRLMTPGTFAAMGIPLARGRDFVWGDGVDRTPVVIVSARLAKVLWPGADPLGKRVRNARSGSPWLTVVGVVGDVADSRDRADPNVTWYLPYLQHAGTPAASELHVMLRAPSSVLADVRRTLSNIDGALAAYDVAEMDDYYAQTLDRDRVGAFLIAVIGAFGLLLAALGVYGVMSFAVAQRTGEIGIRIALGATRGAIMSFVFGGAIRIAIAGLAVGCAGSVVVRRVLASILPAVPPSALAPAAASSIALIVVIACACYVPARRATRVDPLHALRS